jgi:type IV secretion system protein VirD4
MSSGRSGRSWGPSHQHMEPPFKRKHSLAARAAAVLIGVPLFLFLADSMRLSLGFAGDLGGLFAWIVGAVIVLVALRLGLMLVMGVLTRPRRVTPGRAPPLRAPRGRVEPDAGHAAGTTGRARGVSSAARAREASIRLGGGAYLGVDEYGGWVTADPESAVMILGPPRSGKTSAVMIPALMACAGAAISTSTKRDAMRATLPARSEIGQAWLFDPSGSETTDTGLPGGVRRLCWSPVAAAASWDEALVMARAMTAATNPGAGTTNESHWSERAAALLAPLLYAAHHTNQTVAEVLRWTLRGDLAPAQAILADLEAPIAADVLAGIERTDQRERSSIFSATAGVLAAYNADAVRSAAANPNFEPSQFATSTDTIYITAPEHKQALCAPLIVGLLEQIRHAAYEHARNHTPTGPPMLWALDEVANTAPINDLPALISQAGSQHLQVMIGLQDLSQARTRWGAHQADALLSLFQTKLILAGIADPRTLEAISLVLGEYDRDTISQTLGQSEPQEWLAHPTHTDTVNYHTQRQRVLTPGEVARLPDGHALLLEGADWNTIQLTPWHQAEPWKTISSRHALAEGNGLLVVRSLGGCKRPGPTRRQSQKKPSAT